MNLDRYSEHNFGGLKIVRYCTNQLSPNYMDQRCEDNLR